MAIGGPFRKIELCFVCILILYSTSIVEAVSVRLAHFVHFIVSLHTRYRSLVFQLDNRGFRLVADSEISAINTPALAAAHVTKRWAPQACDELALEVRTFAALCDSVGGNYH